MLTLLERKVDLVCGDAPTATNFTIRILAAVVEFERERTKRTRQTLATAVRGTTRDGRRLKLGNGERVADAKQRTIAGRAESVRPAIVEPRNLSTRVAADALTVAAS